MTPCIYCGAGPEDDCTDDCETRAWRKVPCDGSGWLYGADRQGFGETVSCPGCEVCGAVLVIDRAVLADLMRVHGAMTGTLTADDAQPPLETTESIGMILTYLPALIQMATDLLNQRQPVDGPRGSAHTLLQSGLVPGTTEPDDPS